MADNIAINPGSGVNVAADEIASVQYQRQKITLGADGVNDGDVSSTNPLPVRGYGFDQTVVFTRPADILAYIAGDCYSNSTSVPTAGGHVISNVVRSSAGAGLLTDLFISISAPSAMRGRIWLFNQALGTTPVDNAPIAIADADILNCIGCYPFEMAALSGNSFCHLQNLAKAFKTVGSFDLRLLVEVTSPFTPTSGETISIRASGLQVT